MNVVSEVVGNLCVLSWEEFGVFFFFLSSKEQLYLHDSNNGLISLKFLKKNNKPGLKMLEELFVCVLFIR